MGWMKCAAVAMVASGGERKGEQGAAIVYVEVVLSRVPLLSVGISDRVCYQR
jgi:hypothetical protein